MTQCALQMRNLQREVDFEINLYSGLIEDIEEEIMYWGYEEKLNEMKELIARFGFASWLIPKAQHFDLINSVDKNDKIAYKARKKEILKLITEKQELIRYLTVQFKKNFDREFDINNHRKYFEPHLFNYETDDILFKIFVLIRKNVKICDYDLFHDVFTYILEGNDAIFEAYRHANS